MSTTNFHPSSADQDDRELARETRSGSLAAFDRLVDRHHARVFRFLKQLTGNQQDAEDITQLVFLKAFRKIHQFNPTYRFETWIFAIARR